MLLSAISPGSSIVLDVKIGKISIDLPTMYYPRKIKIILYY